MGNRFHVTLRIVSPYILFQVNPVSWMCVQDKKKENTPKNEKKQQPTENQKNTKYQNVSLKGTGFGIYLAMGGGSLPLPPSRRSVTPQ